MIGLCGAVTMGRIDVAGCRAETSCRLWPYEYRDTATSRLIRSQYDSEDFPVSTTR